MRLGIAKQRYCLHPHTSPEIFCQTTLWESGVIHLLNKLLTLLRIQGFAPLGFSQQYEDQQDTSEKVFMLKEPGDVSSFFGWRRHSGTFT